MTKLYFDFDYFAKILFVSSDNYDIILKEVRKLDKAQFLEWANKKFDKILYAKILEAYNGACFTKDQILNDMRTELKEMINKVDEAEKEITRLSALLTD